MVGVATLLARRWASWPASTWPNMVRSRPLASLIRFINDILLSAPSIVIGLFVYALVVDEDGALLRLGRRLSRWHCCRFPIVVRTTENMLNLVPNALREAAVALGTPKWKMVMSITVQVVVCGHRYRRAAGRGPYRRRDRAAAVHGAVQPVLDQRPEQADGQPAGDDLPASR